jgi:hypothetical protein
MALLIDVHIQSFVIVTNYIQIPSHYIKRNRYFLSINRSTIPVNENKHKI